MSKIAQICSAYSYHIPLHTFWPGPGSTRPGSWILFPWKMPFNTATSIWDLKSPFKPYWRLILLTGTILYALKLFQTKICYPSALTYLQNIVGQTFLVSKYGHNSPGSDKWSSHHPCRFSHTSRPRCCPSGTPSQFIVSLKIWDLYLFISLFGG